jgi:hypothetical protein
MLIRGMTPIVRETLERVVVVLWFIGILLLLYLTLRSQLARGNEPEAEWDLVALCGGTVDVRAAYDDGRTLDIDGCTADTGGAFVRTAIEPRAAGYAPLRRRPAP